MGRAFNFPRGTLSYTMSLSLDGYIEDPTGGIGFGEPDEELHRSPTNRARETAAFLLDRAGAGRRGRGGGGVRPQVCRDAADRVLRLAGVGRARVPAGAPRLRGRGGDPAQKAADCDLAVGGAGLAASLLDLIDEFRPRVVPASPATASPMSRSAPTCGYDWSSSAPSRAAPCTCAM